MTIRIPIKQQLLWSIGVVGVAIAVLAVIKFMQIRAAIASNRFAPPPEAVTAVVAEQQEWQRTIRAVGSLTAVQGVTLSSETAGVVTKIYFESGSLVTQGDIIVELDTSVEEANLRAAQAVLASAEPAYNRAKKLFETKATSQAELETAEATVRGARAAVASLQAQIEKKVIKAPFAGRLGIRLVNLGEYVNPGTPIIPLHDTSSIFADFSVPQTELQRVSIGNKVQLKIGGVDERSFEGSITAINPQVDPKTRNIFVQARLPNPEGLLRPGMFAEIVVRLPQVDVFATLPASSISFAPYGDSVFVVETIKDERGNEYQGVREQTVTLGPRRGDQVAIVHGLTAGQKVVSSGTFKLRPGMAVQVHDALEVGNEADPSPPDA